MEGNRSASLRIRGQVASASYSTHRVPISPGKFVAVEVHTYQSPLLITFIEKNRWTQ